MKTKMAGAILKCCFVLFLFTKMSAQSLIPMLDTPVIADQVYLDLLNNIYLVDATHHQLRKYDATFHAVQEIDLDRGWDQARMDVSDPFKILLYSAGEYRVYLLDANLSKISSFDDADLNQQAGLCYFSSEEIAVFDGRMLKIKNPYSGKELSGAQLAQEATGISQGLQTRLIRHRDALYLFRPGLGLFRYTTQLFEDRVWPDKDMLAMDLIGDQILCLYNDNRLVRYEPYGWFRKELYQGVMQIRSLSSNAHLIALLEGERLKIFQIMN